LVLVVVRHGKAEERSDYSGNDRLRPLTDEGRDRMRENAKHLRKLFPKIDVLISSPLVRAQQTAEILQQEYGIKKIQNTENLSPGFNRAELLKYLKDQQGETLCIVGHEPDLGEFCSWVLTGNSHSFVPLRKGGVCVVEFEGAVIAKSATLVLKLDPRHM
jgi:phosphohistidine phosphatase